MELQSWLDTCSCGSFDNSSLWKLQHSNKCGDFRRAAATRAAALCCNQCIASCPSSCTLWLHVAGDSTMRFFYAGLLSQLNGTTARAAGYPLHWMPNNDSCSFVRAGWPSTSTNRCYQRWRGRCHQGAKAACFLDARGISADGVAWRLSFEWWHYTAKYA